MNVYVNFNYLSFYKLYPKKYNNTNYEVMKYKTEDFRICTCLVAEFYKVSNC